MFNGNSAAGTGQSNANIQVEAKNRSATDNGKAAPALVQTFTTAASINDIKPA
jgi:hypothetical protein